MSLLQGLTAYWNLNETSGTRADFTGNYPLTETGSVGSDNFSPQFNPGAFTGPVAEFPGVGEFLSRTNADDFHLEAGNLAVSVWFKIDAFTSFGHIVGKFYNETNGLNWTLSLSSTVLNFSVARIGTTRNNITFTIPDTTVTDSAIPTFNRIAVGRWYHFVGMKEQNKGIRGILSNGTETLRKEAIDKTSGGVTIPSTSRFSIGARCSSSGATAFPFQGKIANVGIWNRTLSQSEVGTLWNGGYGLDAESLI